MSPQRPSASGARIAGDDYQHLFTWLQALKLLRETEGVTSIGLEIGGNHNVDDVVVYRAPGPALYHQVKFVTDQRDPLTHTWFTTVPRDARRSPLQRFHESFVNLTNEGEPPQMALETNRLPAAGDPVLRHIDGRTNKLVPRLFEPGPSSASGRARRGWSDHLGVSEDELADMLDHLEIRAGRGSLEELREHCCWLMAAIGLQDDLNAVDIGMGEMRRLIREGVRELDQARLREIIATRRLEAAGRRATLLVQQIDADPWPELATASVDWVELFEGDEPGARRQLRDPRGWNEVLRPQLREAASTIRQLDVRDVLLTGKMRLSAGFLAGFELSDVAGYSIAIRQRGEEWASTGERAAVDLAGQEIEIGRGAELAIAVAVAADLTDDVCTYLESERIPVAQLLVLHPEPGPGRDLVAGPAHARGLAAAILDTSRAAARATATPTVHLFQAAPLALAVLLGHVWNRMPPTQLYEDLGAGRGYAPAFTLPA